MYKVYCSWLSNSIGLRPFCSKSNISCAMATNYKLNELNQQSDLLAKKLKEIEEKKSTSKTSVNVAPNDGNFMKNFLNKNESKPAGGSKVAAQPLKKITKTPTSKSRFSSMFQQMKQSKQQANIAPPPPITSVSAKCFHNDDSSSSDEDGRAPVVKKPRKASNANTILNRQTQNPTAIALAKAQAMINAAVKTPSAIITSSLPQAQAATQENNVKQKFTLASTPDLAAKAKKKKNRWGEKLDLAEIAPPGLAEIPGMANPVQMVQQSPAALGLPANYRPPGLVGVQSLSDAQKKQIEEQREMQAMYSLVMANRQATQQAAAVEAAKEKAKEAANKKKFKHEYDSDEDIDEVSGTWEHQQRMMEMEKTKALAEKLTDEGQGKHFIGDFLPPAELEKFMETFKALKEGRTPDYSDYKEFKIQCDNVGFKMLQRMGWEEGSGLGSEGQGITNPVNQGQKSIDGRGLGIEKPDNLSKDDDDFSAYRKRMMLAYKFRPNPLNNPRRPYY